MSPTQGSTPGPAVRGARRFTSVRRLTATGLGAALLVCGLAGCFGGGDDKDMKKATATADQGLPGADLHPASDAKVRDGGTLRVGVTSFPATFNPVHADGVGSTAPQILAPTTGSAIQVDDRGDWSVDRDYARSVEITDRDPLTVRVELNPRAVWQGGSPITSNDMVAYVAAMQDDDFAAAGPPVLADVDEVRPDGRFAYDVVFDEPNTDWPDAVYPALPAAVTKSPTVFNRTLVSRPPSSNGPFRVASIARETGTITLERNPRWWGATPRLGRIVFRVADAPVLADAYTAGELEAVPVTPDNRDRLLGAKEQFRTASGSDWAQLTLNGGSPVLSDARVRQAIWAAVDADGIVESTGRRYGTRAARMDTVVLLPNQVGHQAPAGTGRDLARARQLLAKAGWTRTGDATTVTKDGRPLTLRLPVPDTMTGAVQRAEEIRDDLAEVGVTVVVTQVPGATFFDQVVIPLDFDLTTFTWSGAAFPVTGTRRLFTPIDSPLNFTGKASKAITAAFDAAIATLDPADRTARIAAVEKVATAQASIMPLVVIPRVMAVEPAVRNFGPTSLAAVDWTRVGFAATTTDQD